MTSITAPNPAIICSICSPPAFVEANALYKAVNARTTAAIIAPIGLATNAQRTFNKLPAAPVAPPKAGDSFPKLPVNAPTPPEEPPMLAVSLLSFPAPFVDVAKSLFKVFVSLDTFFMFDVTFIFTFLTSAMVCF